VSQAAPQPSPHSAPKGSGGPDAGRAADTRRRILDAAIRCFGQRGFRRTRVEEVAERAGVSRALVHGYFGSKALLLRAVQEHFVRNWSQALDDIVREAEGPREALAAWLRHSLADDDRRALLRALFASDILEVSEDWRSATEATRRAALARHQELLQRGVESGVFRASLDIEATAAVLHTFQVGLLREFVDPQSDERVTTPRQVDAAVALVIRGLEAA
jgi:AcrR family transcriptional regulator